MQKKILIAEDEHSMRDILKTTLTKAGFSVMLAKEGGEALAVARSEKPDLIILDILLPVMDGITVLKKIREYGMRVPVIILTNLSSDDRIMEGVVRDEPSYYLIKSDSSIEDIVAKVKMTMETQVG